MPAPLLVFASWWRLCFRCLALPYGCLCLLCLSYICVAAGRYFLLRILVYTSAHYRRYRPSTSTKKNHHPPHTSNMHATTLLITGLATLAAASPMNVVRRQDSPSPDVAPYPYDSSDSSDSDTPSPSGGFNPYPAPSGMPIPSGGNYPYSSPSGMPTPSGAYYPTGTGVSVPYPTGQASCPTDGALVCNGPSQFGLCNFGQVVWQQVALGTQCQDGQIVFAPGYGTAATASGVAAAPSGY